MHLRPCYEFRNPDDENFEFRFLNGTMTESDIWDFLVSLCMYSTDRTPDHPKDSIPILLEQEDDEVVIAGGLAVISDNFKLLPGCCCGLEDWREWENVKPGGGSPWLGHDPDAWVECLPTHAIVHTDDSPQHETHAINYDDISKSLSAAEKDLDSMLILIGSTTLELELCSKIDKWFSITRHHSRN